MSEPSMVKNNASPEGGTAGVMSTGWDGNYSVNYANVKNVRDLTHIHYGEEDEDCPGCMGVGM